MFVFLWVFPKLQVSTGRQNAYHTKNYACKYTKRRGDKGIDAGEEIYNQKYAFVWMKSYIDLDFRSFSSVFYRIKIMSYE